MGSFFMKIIKRDRVLQKTSSNCLFLYSDASYSHQSLFGIAGYLLFKNVEDHVENRISSAILKSSKIKETNNIRLELKAAIMALDAAWVESDTSTVVELFTDCQTISNLISRRAKLEASDFLSKKQGKTLHNADLYKHFFSIYDKLLPKITWVKGHSRKKEQNFIHRNFSMLDRFVRRELREDKKLNG